MVEMPSEEPRDVCSVDAKVLVLRKVCNCGEIATQASGNRVVPAQMYVVREPNNDESLNG